jgi:tryptophan 2,3-dioxygenase
MRYLAAGAPTRFERSHWHDAGLVGRRPRRSISVTCAGDSDMTITFPPVTKMTAESIDYHKYLSLSDLLACQRPVAPNHGRVAHDEMLFIIVHQTYELWFKQILHELDRIEQVFAGTVVAEAALPDVVRSFERVVAILRIGVQQLDVLETMTPLDFLDFRDLLSTASGFQSLQFRLIEARLGLAEARQLLFGSGTAHERFSERDRETLVREQQRTTVLDALDAWLGRTPFVSMGDFAFDRAYREAIDAMLDGEIGRVRADVDLDLERRQQEIDALENARDAFGSIFADASAGPVWRMSPRSIRAALFIMLYRDRPALQLPFRLLAALMDIDATMTMWRYRHALMVQRMIGVKTGTGGSSGYVYLRRAADQHRIFLDLFRLSTYLIPRSAIPALPQSIEQQMRFVYMAAP